MIKSKGKTFLITLSIGLTLANFAFAALVQCGGPGQSECQVTDLIFTIERIINFLLSWAWLISIFFILWAGFEMITSGGNQENIAKGKTTLQHAIIGFLLIMMSYLVINLVVGILIGQPQSGGFDLIRNILPKP